MWCCSELGDLASITHMPSTPSAIIGTEEEELGALLIIIAVVVASLRHRPHLTVARSLASK